MKAYERFLNYVVVHTASSEESSTVPTTERQFDLARMLVSELRALGVEDAEVDDKCYVYGHIPATKGYESRPALGFIAHMDTVPDFSGENVKPRLIENYDGGTIVLGESGRSLTAEQFPHLPSLKGRTLIVTDGTTVLGGDDKAGIAEIVQAMCWLRDHDEVKHGDIRVAFNPDEEIGMGAHHFDVEKFGCQWAYTMDGGDIGDLEYENFNAAGAKVTIKGVSVHTGYAKGKMINASRLACEFNSHIPDTDIPETTEGYEGFYHLLSINSHCEEAKLSYIIRDHDRKKFEQRKDFMEHIAEEMNAKYGEGTVTIDIKDQYYNMKEKIDPNMYVIDIVLKAMQESGVRPKVEPIRGGTDGAQLSFRGLPCPNIFAGGVNFHGPYEFVSIQVMQKAVEVIVKICQLTEGFNE